MGDNGAMTKTSSTSKDTRISVRVSPEMKSRVEAVIAKTGIEESVLVRTCIEALIKYVEETGQISFPLTINKGASQPEISSNPETAGRPAEIHASDPSSTKTSPGTVRPEVFDLTMKTALGSAKPAKRARAGVKD
jgi:antitoxin component of RelBE/YafQ-DinJ toxin-antitoxin module